MQTNAAIHSGGPQVETNAALGKQPSALALYGGLGVNLGVITALMVLPQGEDRIPNPISEGYLNTLPPFVVDGLLTLTAVATLGFAYNDNHMAPRTTCGL